MISGISAPALLVASGENFNLMNPSSIITTRLARSGFLVRILKTNVNPLCMRLM